MLGNSEIKNDPCQWVIQPEPEIEDLVPMFMRNRFKELAQMEQADSQGDDAEIRRLAHLWKGVCRPYGFIELEGLSRELEDAAKASDRARVRAIVAYIKTCLNNVKIVSSGGFSPSPGAEL